MTIASGVFKSLRYKKQSGLASPASGSGAQILRRVTSDIDASKDAYASQEIRSDMQISDFRHGLWKIGGGIRGEMSPGTYKDLIASALRRDFAAVTAISSLSITVAGSGPTYTLTRGSGSWLTDGVKDFMVVKLTAGSFNAANLNKHLFVEAVTSATVLTVRPVNGVALVAEGPIASATLSIPGKVTYAPVSSHTADYYTFEHWFADIAQSEVFSDCKIGGLDIGLPGSGMSSIGIDVMGLKVTTGTSQNFSSPTAAPSTGVIAAANGVLRIGGSTLATVTGLSIKLAGGMSVLPVVGSNYAPDVFPGRINVTGQFTALFDGATFRDAFLNESEIALGAVFSTGTGAAADFVAFAIPRLKLGNAAKSDGEQGLILTCPFQALYNGSGGAGASSEATSLWTQDSQA